MKLIKISIIFFSCAALSFAEDAGTFKTILLKDAEKGNLKSQITVAEIYYYGGGYGGIKTGSAVEQNYTEAFKWHSRAAAQGDISAKYKIALMLYEGNGVKQDKKKAVKIIKEMQNAGDEEAIAFLDKMLEEDLKSFSNLDAAE